MADGRGMLGGSKLASSSGLLPASRMIFSRRTKRKVACISLALVGLFYWRTRRLHRKQATTLRSSSPWPTAEQQSSIIPQRPSPAPYPQHLNSSTAACQHQLLGVLPAVASANLTAGSGSGGVGHHSDDAAAIGFDFPLYGLSPRMQAAVAPQLAELRAALTSELPRAGSLFVELPSHGDASSNPDGYSGNVLDEEYSLTVTAVPTVAGSGSNYSASDEASVLLTARTLLGVRHGLRTLAALALRRPVSLTCVRTRFCCNNHPFTEVRLRC